MLLLRSALTLLLATGLALALAPPQEPPALRIEPVAGKVAVLFGEGGNIGISSGADGILLVDGQFARLAPAIEQALARLAGPTQALPRLLVNTHHHDDHTDGNKRFGKVALVLAHENVRARMVEAEAPAAALPVVTYADGLALHFNAEEIRLLHVPGAHTDGDTVVWFTGSNAIHMGDLYFQLGYPFVDTAAGGNVLGLIEGLRALLARLPADVRVIPGHGEVSGKDGLEEYVRMLATITERVRAGLVEGLDSEALVAAGVTEDFDARWGNFAFVPARRFVQSVVDSLR